MHSAVTLSSFAGVMIMIDIVLANALIQRNSPCFFGQEINIMKEKMGRGVHYSIQVFFALPVDMVSS